MTKTMLVLIDPHNRTSDDRSVLLSSGHPGGVSVRRLRGGPSDGIDVVDLDNGHLKLAILPTRGMGIWKGVCGNIPLEWKSPVEHPVHPSLVDAARRGGIGWLDGFNEIICRCGLSWNGAPGTDVRRDPHGNVISEQFLPLHGRIANLAAHEVYAEADTDGTIRVVGIVDESSLFDQRLRLTSELSTKVKTSSFAIRDTVTNLGGQSAEVEMLYHCNFGRPLLEGASSFHMAAKTIAPRDARAAEDTDAWSTFLPPTTGYAEQVYFVEPLADISGNALAVLKDSTGGCAVGLTFRTATLPWFSLWKNTQAEADGYVCGLEPGSGLPNNRQFEREQGRVVLLDAGASVTFEMEFEIAENTDQTQALLDRVAELQQESEPALHKAPLARFTPS